MRHFTESEYKRLQRKVDQKKPGRIRRDDPPGLYGQVETLEKKVRVLEKRMDYVYVRFLKGVD